ncbi:ubiquitin carboxyl-terminal hydrolase family protein [Tasmannia lanceolata]|uniref:ubiquitin carboxyl-terminal hydrolase family protein n=1 Tax=Tasmannia lanceolata TaxID=3420 RepID=UPI00406311F3
MKTSFPILSSKPNSLPPTLLQSTFLPPSIPNSKTQPTHSPLKTQFKKLTITSSSSIKITPNPPLDRHITKHNKLKFAQKLKTLLLSKPHNYLPLKVLSKCRSYLSLTPSHSTLSMIKRYPAIFELFSSPSDALSVRLTPAASSLAAHESLLKSQLSNSLSIKLQKLLMLSPHRRLLLSKLVHLAPDLGLPPNFRSRLCNNHPNRFKTVDTSYGRALQLVSWDPILATPLPKPKCTHKRDLIIDRPAKFKLVNVRKGLNLKRRHRDFLIKFGELPEINPYLKEINLPLPHTMEAEKRACGVVREVLGMTVEKRTLVDHLTHFRKDFGLSNKLRGMLVRHPEMFYVSLKGQRDSVFLVEGYDEKGGLVEKDELLVVKERLTELVREGKRMRRDRRNGVHLYEEDDDIEEDYSDGIEDEEDGFEELFDSGIEDGDWEYFGDGDDGGDELLGNGEIEEFWTVKASENGEVGGLESW